MPSYSLPLQLPPTLPTPCPAALVQIPALSFNTCLTLVKLLNLSVSHFLCGMVIIIPTLGLHRGRAIEVPVIMAII